MYRTLYKKSKLLMLTDVAKGSTVTKISVKKSTMRMISLLIHVTIQNLQMALRKIIFKLLIN